METATRVETKDVPSHGDGRHRANGLCHGGARREAVSVGSLLTVAALVIIAAVIVVTRTRIPTAIAGQGTWRRKDVKSWNIP